MENKPVRITKLDGLRGILSLVVALNHSFLVLAIPKFADIWGQNILNFHDWQSKINQLLMLAGNGGAAVSLFFVLSGFVMGQSLDRMKINISGIFKFYLKRITRLYPVYFFTIVLVSLYLRFFFVYQTFAAASSWMHWWYQFSMTWKEYLLNALFVNINLGGVTWTLRVIVVASFLFPFLYQISRRSPKILDLPICIILIFVTFKYLTFPQFRDFRYLYMFYLGLSLPRWQNEFSRFPKKVIPFLVPLVIYIMFAFRYLTDEYTGGIAESFISFIIMGLIVYGPTTNIFNFLDRPILQFFGKISYSLYLMHFSILYAIAKIMLNIVPAETLSSNYLLFHFSLLVVSLPIATGFSYLVYRYVEKPTAKLIR